MLKKPNIKNRKRKSQSKSQSQQKCFTLQWDS
jgi:hypothetical protein